MDNVNVSDNIKPVTAETAQAEQNDTAAQNLGKFESVDALLNAYKSLEAEFTRRSQRLKELEEGNKAQNMPDGALSRDAKQDREDFVNAAKNDVEVKEAVIGEYLKTVFNGKTVPLIVGGVSTPAPKNRPQSVKEAGALVKNFLKD